MMAKYKKNNTSRDEAMRFIGECLEVCRINYHDESTRGHVGIASNADHELQHYFWATGEQRQLAKKLGDMVMLDNTFNTNQWVTLLVDRLCSVSESFEDIYIIYI